MSGESIKSKYFIASLMQLKTTPLLLLPKQGITLSKIDSASEVSTGTYLQIASKTKI